MPLWWWTMDLSRQPVLLGTWCSLSTQNLDSSWAEFQRKILGPEQGKNKQGSLLYNCMFDSLVPFFCYIELNIKYFHFSFVRYIYWIKVRVWICGFLRIFTLGYPKYWWICIRKMTQSYIVVYRITPKKLRPKFSKKNFWHLANSRKTLKKCQIFEVLSGLEWDISKRPKVPDSTPQDLF